MMQAQRQLREVNAAASPGSIKGNDAKIYISYARRDVAMSALIGDTLRREGFDVLLDRADIVAGENWSQRVREMITQADKVVVLISPDAAESIQVGQELETAAQSGKIIVPVLVRDVPVERLPQDIAKLNFVFMRDEIEKDRGISALLRTLATDMAWIREQTRINDVALTWDRKKRNSAYLLRGEAQAAAERWLTDRPASAPPLTSLQLEFIMMSRRAQVSRRRLLLGSLTLGLFISLMLSAMALWQRSVALEEGALAVQQRNVAVKSQFEARKFESRAEELENALRELDPDNPLLRH
jgi:TIR domain